MVADGPPLEVPAAPPRVIAAIDDRLAATPQPVDPPTTPAQRTPTAPPGRRPASPPAEGEGREPAATPAAAAAPATPTPAPDAPRDLRPAGSADAEAEKKARSLVGQALQTLSRIDSRTLSTENKTQFEEARRFVERAELEIKDRNFVFAETFADKAVTLATQLLGR